MIVIRASDLPAPRPLGNDDVAYLGRAALRFWRKIHREGLCRHDTPYGWAECEALAHALREFTAFGASREDHQSPIATSSE